MSDNLAKRLRDSAAWYHADCELKMKCVDRIEELEAKLAKAELIVRIIASDKWNERLGEVVDLSCEYLEELTGGKDE